MPQFIYTMKGLGKVHPPDNKVLEDIWLSFYFRREDRRPRAERRGQELAAAHHGRRRHEFPRRSVRRRGHLDRLPARRSRASIPRRPCSATSRRASPPPRRCSPLRRDQREARRGSVAGRDGEGPRRAGEGPGQDRRRQRLGSRLAASSSPWTRCGCRPPDADVTTLSGGERRRVALCQAAAPAPDLLLLDEPTNHLDAESVAWLERFLQGLPRHRRRRHARPLFPRQRRRLDSRARPRPRHSVEGQLFLVARAEAGRLAAGRESRVRRKRTLGARAGMGPDGAARAPAKSKARLTAYEKLAARGTAQKTRPPRSTFRRVRASATSSSKRATSRRATATSC